MEVFWCKFSLMGSRKTSVFRVVFFSVTDDYYFGSGCRKKRYLVRCFLNSSFSRAYAQLLASSAIIEDIRTLQKSGLASLAFFYCDFRDDEKKDRRGLLSSLLIQLGEQSDVWSAILSRFYEDHRRGFEQSYASDSELVGCLTCTQVL